MSQGTAWSASNCNRVGCAWGASNRTACSWTARHQGGFACGYSLSLFWASREIHICLCREGFFICASASPSCRQQQQLPETFAVVVGVVVGVVAQEPGFELALGPLELDTPVCTQWVAAATVVWAASTDSRVTLSVCDATRASVSMPGGLSIRGLSITRLADCTSWALLCL